RPLRGCRGTGCAVPLDGCTGQPCRAGARRGDPGRRGSLRVRAAVRVGRPGLATAAAAVPRAAVPRPGGAWRRGERGARRGRTTAHLCGGVAAVGGGRLPVPRVARPVRTGTAAAAALATPAGRRRTAPARRRYRLGALNLRPAGAYQPARISRPGSAGPDQAAAAARPGSAGAW